MSAYTEAEAFFREFEDDPEYNRERAIARAQTNIAVNINRLRRERSLTQAQLAERAGMRQPRIAEIERGEYNPRLDTLAKLAWALGVGLSELTGEEPVAEPGRVAAPAKFAYAEVVEDPFSLYFARFGRGSGVRLSQRGHAFLIANDNFALSG